MISRIEIFAYAKERYDIEPDYPWARTPNYAILQHNISRKWFGAVVDITEDKLGLNGNRLIDVLLLKCDPVLIGSLRQEAGILPAYHMNKDHWISVLLDGSCPKEKVFSLIDLSFDITKVRSKDMNKPRIFTTSFNSVYPLYIEKAAKKGRTKAEVDQIIFWLTGHNADSLQKQLENDVSLEVFYENAPQINPNASLITGVICGHRVEEIEDKVMQKIRYLDKLIDELAKGKSMEKILRK